MGKKTPPSDLYPLWTTARVNAFLRSGFRRMSRTWPPMFDALKRDRRRSEDGKRYEYQCYVCQLWYNATSVQVDHLDPCGSLNGFDGAEAFLRKLFCSVDGLGTICKGCHQTKTKLERGS